AALRFAKCSHALRKRHARENELDRQIGDVPELDVGARPITNGLESAALDLVAPQLVVLESRRFYRPIDFGEGTHELLLVCGQPGGRPALRLNLTRSVDLI